MLPLEAKEGVLRAHLRCGTSSWKVGKPIQIVKSKPAVLDLVEIGQGAELSPRPSGKETKPDRGFQAADPQLCSFSCIPGWRLETLVAFSLRPKMH